MSKWYDPTVAERAKIKSPQGGGEAGARGVPAFPSAYRAPSLMPKNFVDKNATVADVPCGKCQLCCKTLIVPLAEEEYENYDWAWITTRDGKRHGRALQRKANGDCVYLGENGCTIHGHAPHVCQRFDCRELFLKSDRQFRRSGQLPKSLFEKGREMLKEHPL
jgi:hypothetical protein